MTITPPYRRPRRAYYGGYLSGPGSRPRNGLTRMQESVLRFAVEMWAAEQRFPSMREIGAAFKIKSPNGVMSHLRALARKGYLRMSDFKARGHEVAGLADAVRPAALAHLDQLLTHGPPARANAEEPGR